MADATYQAASDLDDRLAPRRFVSWGAIFSGVVMVLVVQLVLSLLGIGIGASTIDPLREQDPLRGVGTGAGIWLIVSALISLFAGSYVAGRLSGRFNREDNLLHGLLTWGVATLLSLVLLSTALGNVLGGASMLVQRGANLLGSGVTSVAPAVGGVLERELGERGIDVTALGRDASNILMPGSQAMETQVGSIISRMVRDGSFELRAGERQSLLSLMTTQGNMSTDEANAALARAEASLANVQGQAATLRQEAESTAREAGDTAARAASQGALWGFVGLLLGALSSAMGGILGGAHHARPRGPSGRRQESESFRPAHRPS